MKKEIEKMNMVLNNLEQKLLNKEELCIDVANLIDLIVETNELIERLKKIDTHILVVKARIRNLIKELSTDRDKQIEKTMLYIIGLQDDEHTRKIRKTIENCVENYDVYQQSNYYQKYHTEMEDEKAIQLLDLIL